MPNTISLAKPIKAIDPDSGDTVEIVGIDIEPAFGPRLIVLTRGPHGIFAKSIDYADEVPQ